MKKRIYSLPALRKALQRTNRRHLELSPPATNPRLVPIGHTRLPNRCAKSIVAMGDSTSSQRKARTCSRSLRGVGLTLRDCGTRTMHPHKPIPKSRTCHNTPICKDSSKARQRHDRVGTIMDVGAHGVSGTPARHTFFIWHGCNRKGLFSQRDPLHKDAATLSGDSSRHLCLQRS
jgi:hypothetical protein